MPFQKLEQFTRKVSDLSDKPTLSPRDLKEVFDAAPNEVRESLNELIDALKNTSEGDSGAKNIGASTITGVNGNDIQTMLESIKNQLDQVSVGEIKNTSLTVNQSLAPVGNTGSIEQLISWLTNRVKAITGTTNWYDSFPEVVKKSTEVFTPTLLNGWKPNASTYPNRYWKEGSTVYFELAVSGGNMDSGTVIMYFPPGFRPDGACMFEGYVDALTPKRILYHVRGSDGELKLIRGLEANSLVIFRGSFRAVN